MEDLADQPPRRYSPSPQPVFDGPARISAEGVTRHIWGDRESGEVADWIFCSTEKIHCLIFGLAPGAAFRHSPEYRTVFDAHEVLTVLTGTMLLANPAVGELQRVERGQSATLSPGTWHHAFAHGDEPLRVLEFLAPPPSAGTTGAFARRQEYLGECSYADDGMLGTWPKPRRAAPTIGVVRDEAIVWRRDLDVLTGILSSTEALTVMRVEVGAGEKGVAHAHGGDELIYVTEGVLHVRAWFEGAGSVYELGPGDGCYLPQGATHQYFNYGKTLACALKGVAPTYLS